jgi:CHAT domain-containing protein
LLVSAHGALGALPFALLVPDARRQGFLADRIAVTRLPGALRRSSAMTRASALTFFAMGDTGIQPGNDSLAMRGGRVEGLDRLPRLAQASGELQDIAAAIGARAPVILTGQAATEQAFTQFTIQPGSVVAFATHGLVSGEFEGLREPALVLSAAGNDDGLLTASEISRMDIPAAWVILSACNTAAGSGPDAPSLSGLAQAFILAGADNILATHWPVRDDVARAITSGTMRHNGKGAAPAEALRLAIADWRKAHPQEAGHPGLWAAFELVRP